VSKGLEKTAQMWPAIEQGYGWVHRAARVLENEAGQDVLLVRREYRALLREMTTDQAQLGELAWAVPHFRKVTMSYWSGLFRCYETGEVPRTNNDREQCFGSVRYHERRTSGRKGAAPGLVVRGQVRLLAAVATRTREVKAEDLRLGDVGAWRALREELETRQEARRRQLRFRRDPQAYLRSLEERLLKLSLPTSKKPSGQGQRTFEQ
jgi:hypothetical protein